MVRADVLVVDDEAEIVEELCEFLLSRGHGARGASCVPDAVHLLKTAAELNAVISDFRMPGLSGLDLLRLCRTEADLEPRALNFVMMTGQTELTETAMQEIKSAGATLIHKPVGTKRILELLAGSRPR